MPVRPKHLKKSSEFPKLAKKKNKVTSDKDPDYNCIAFAAGVTDKKFWPVGYPDYIWPIGPFRPVTVASFEELYASYGYTRANSGAYVKGIEKIAIYATPTGTPTHAARQIGPGKWASKLGDWYDIEHTIDAVSAGDYGEIAIYMQRKMP